MRIITVCIIIILFASGVLEAQTKFDRTIDSVLSLSGLNRNDVSLPFFGDENKEYSNNKLLLRNVKESLLDPLNTINFINALKNISNTVDPGYFPGFLIRQLMSKPLFYKGLEECQNYTDSKTYKILEEKCLQIVQNRTEREQLLSVVNNTEKIFLKNNILNIVLNTESNSDSAKDIFRFNQSRDSALIKAEHIILILSKIDRDKYDFNLLKESMLFYNLYNFLKINTGFLKNLKFNNYNNENLIGSFALLKYSGLEIVVGDTGKNIYHGNFDIIIDLGGNDIYELDNSQNNGLNWIIDLKGDDIYTSLSDFSVAGAYFSSSFILDVEGNDIYKGSNVSLGASIAGVSAIIDLNGDDNYIGKVFTCGSGFFGAGLIYDAAGNDTYSSECCSQGFGMTQGIGMICDLKGNDNYIVKPQVLDVTRYEDHYKSMSQGFGFGLSPYYAGGIGILLDCSGNDSYSCDIYGQGSAYWFSSGYLIDMEGNDNYNSYQYSQGAGIHFASGFLIDDSGDDHYTSNGVSQGCGHDYGFGLLLDSHGNDSYSAYSLSQGAGNANGIGILADLSGIDGYLNKEPSNSRGYGNFRRGTFSLGLFIDANGQDFYSQSGPDNIFSTQSDYGVFADLSIADENTNNNLAETTIPVIENEYTTENLLIMAKTIEPRFRDWQKYGFNKLISDSLKSSDVLLKYLGTDDTRVKLVLVNVLNRMGYTFSGKIANYIPEVINSQQTENQKENILSYACYLLGEYGNNANTGLLLSLTDNASIEVKSYAVNALGKIKNPELKYKKVILEKLNELKKIKTDYISFYKDIVFCLGNYESESSYFTLLEFLSSDYHYTVRLLSSAILKNYQRQYSSLINKNTLRDILNDRIALYWFINSLSEVSESEFDRILGIIDAESVATDAKIKAKITSVIKERQKKMK
jgi:hypothetical protein